jgi:hypothetical protein
LPERPVAGTLLSTIDPAAPAAGAAGWRARIGVEMKQASAIDASWRVRRMIFCLVPCAFCLCQF